MVVLLHRPAPKPTLVTVPVPLTVCQVLSPRRKVDADGVPVAARPVDGTSPVALVRVPDAGVPKTGAVIIGAVMVLLVSV